MQIIQLTRGLATMVNDWNLDYLNQWSWCAHQHSHAFYASRNSSPVNGKRITIYMQDVIGEKLGLIGSIDHIDRNSLNNQEDNLRGVTASQSMANQGLRSDSTSGYKGVTWHKQKQKWHAQIRFHRHQSSLGYFDCPIEAAMVRDNAARRLFKDHATYNFPQEGERGV